MVAKNWCSLFINLTHIPPYAGYDNLEGQVGCVQPADYKVAVYIYVSGWWTKPYWAAPLTPINSDGSWSCDLTTGGTDQLATEYAAFLVPNGYNPPLMSGGQTLPAELYQNSVGYVFAHRQAVYRTIEFSGRTWKVKASETPAGPGPNYFSDRSDDVWVDAQGQLHLRIVNRNGHWCSTEVFSADPFGFGSYEFALASRVDLLDKNAILGLFTWDDTAPQYSYREIDIEFSRWGIDAGLNAQYVVQPYGHAGNRYQFSMTLPDVYSIHRFDWSAPSIQFASFQGSVPTPGNQIQSWGYSGGDIPPAGAGNARINLWLLNGNPPSDGQEIEVIIAAFTFTPQSP